ncbi:unnamed protein product [Rotaria magnacalcarata]|uniref:Deacetylase sirtuin-type domain-containing protein n=1 Tax=Rotaria magnacalcarata TaxID=392030 RepID=A0A816U6S1_9BILA|nr:unnamed protein product [Rotaria magnacalcarata]CAF1660717.1 unnamed protein product [Rotaria magnacalcarata]CAF2055017.1 unnamed protein product [Rotaria magnacalcarata]CAF2104788.1 unnamed protein product [Rotaria magnacalcarata]
MKNNSLSSDVSKIIQPQCAPLSTVGTDRKRAIEPEKKSFAKQNKKSKSHHSSTTTTTAPMLDFESILVMAAKELRQAKNVLVITGAGISADSGLPTYRGIGGLYSNGQETEEGLTIEEALSSYIMRTEPDISWKYICQIESACRSAKQNAAHEALVALESKFEHLTVVTQNVDGLHRSAGTNDLIEIHGNIHQLFCISCDREKYVDDFDGMKIPPTCNRCGGLIRPRIVLFGEMLPTSALTQLSEIVNQGIDAIITIGTSSIFPYIAQPVLRAAENNILTIEINPNDTKVSHVVRYHLRERAIIALPALLKHLS